MATIDNPVGYIFDQGQKGIEERAAGQLAKYKFQEMRDKARSEAEAKQGLASYLGVDSPLGKIAAHDPAMAMKGIEMQGLLAKTGQDKWKFDIEQRIYNVDQLSGMARAFADAPNPDIYNRFKQLYSQIDPQTVLPSYEVAAADPNKPIQAALSLEGISASLKHQKSIFDMRGKPGDDVPFSTEVEAQKTRMDTAKAAAGRAASREFAPSEIEKLVRYKNSLPPGTDRENVESFLSRKADPTGENSASGLDAVLQSPSKAEVKAFNDQQRGITDTLSAIKLLRDHIKENTIETYRVGPFGAKTSGDQATLYNLSLYAFKEAAEMGALQKAEFDSYAKIAPDPSNPLVNMAGTEAALSKLDIFINNLGNKRKTLEDQFARRGKGAKHDKPGVAMPAQASNASVAGPTKTVKMDTKSRIDLLNLRRAQSGGLSEKDNTELLYLEGGGE